ncbi:ER protein carbohydrate-binding protein [Arabidopsis thaliana]|uniref:ER protein carbohydrate-binding protein n=1 Tax=Arabidopsis thaliana TaxID=3702 RepID=F4J800_ARATH|nr:ER protein carbohydrate-binding protein [Arabidopsis thaliana]AEE78139.1 ER protein carbohydrate-binding protein [Arabidopsis thaliana]|eukprot:NP_190210.2 ER protein carbohydrate-binding protein [Arabidopsis thaliana]
MIHAGVNIDCGTSLPGVDNNNLKWVGDQDFITSGDSATISSTTVEKSLTTLRYFPTGDSNCYSNIPVTKGGKVLVRTMFYYGNYDGKSSTPSFSVVFEGKHRGTLSISSAFEPYLLELIFSPAGGETSVCFVRTSSSSNPFVSSIEVVDLDDGMYAELGPGEGRFWLPSEINILVTGIQSTAVSIDTSGASNKPPESVLRNSWTGEGLSLVDPTLPSAGVPVYLAMYFSEPLESSLRSFNIFFGGKQVGRGPVVPLFGKATQVVVRDVVASSSTLLTLWSTSSALLPPMINAAELYVISKGTSESTGGNETGSGSGSGSGGSGGGGSGSSGSGSGSGGTSKGGTGGGSTNGKSSKLPIILGVVSPVAFVLVAYVFIAIILANRRKVRLQALAMPTSTVATMGTGPSTLFTQQMDNDSTSNQPTNEMGEIDDLTG